MFFVEFSQRLPVPAPFESSGKHILMKHTSIQACSLFYKFSKCLQDEPLSVCLPGLDYGKSKIDGIGS
jgi:hypothetical protein